MSLFNELLDILETEDRTVLDVAHGIEVFDAFEELLYLLAWVNLMVDDGQQVKLGGFEGGSLAAYLI
jgi:hypothetical protein